MLRSLVLKRFYKPYKGKKLGNATEIKSYERKVEDENYVPYLKSFNMISNSVRFETKYTDIEELHPSTKENQVRNQDWIRDKKKIEDQRVEKKNKVVDSRQKEIQQSDKDTEKFKERHKAKDNQEKNIEVKGKNTEVKKKNRRNKETRNDYNL